MQVGMISDNGQVEIKAIDTYCYVIANKHNKSYGIRTVSKAIVEQFVDYFTQHPKATATEAKEALKDKTDDDNFEYGYNATFATMAKMILWPDKNIQNAQSWINSANKPTLPTHNLNSTSSTITDEMLPYVLAVRTKPFVLLAGISGTGKSRIVRELARSCWDPNSPEAQAHKPANFEMIQVKPNWHDSSELLGYVSRINGKPVFVAGEFLKFVARAWENPEVPFFLCLDEMNLAPVEQYFAEYLSVIESRKRQADGKIVTDPIIRPESGMTSDGEWFMNLCNSLTTDGELQAEFRNEGIRLPSNLVVIGTVNMDETTYPFSRKVLDRAMTIEMNQVALRGGLDSADRHIAPIPAHNFLGDAVEGYDVYEDNKEVCDRVLDYLESVNQVLEGTPFKVAYRTRNEFLIYVVNALELAPAGSNEKDVTAWALDQVTLMKVLSRIEGDRRKVDFLDKLQETVKNGLEQIHSNKEWPSEKSQSLLKIKKMAKRLLQSGYTSFWE